MSFVNSEVLVAIGRVVVIGDYVELVVEVDSYSYTVVVLDKVFDFNLEPLADIRREAEIVRLSLAV